MRNLIQPGVLTQRRSAFVAAVAADMAHGIHRVDDVRSRRGGHELRGEQQRAHDVASRPQVGHC